MISDRIYLSRDFVPRNSSLSNPDEPRSSIISTDTVAAASLATNASESSLTTMETNRKKRKSATESTQPNLISLSAIRINQYKEYVLMCMNSANSFQPELMGSFFKRYCTPTAALSQYLSQDSDPYIMQGPANITKFFVQRLMTVPDLIIRPKKIEIRKNKGSDVTTVNITISTEATKLFAPSENDTDIPKPLPKGIKINFEFQLNWEINANGYIALMDNRIRK